LFIYKYLQPTNSGLFLALYPVDCNCARSAGHPGIRHRRSGITTRPRTDDGARFRKCRTCCNTSATVITMAELKSAAR